MPYCSPLKARVTAYGVCDTPEYFYSYIDGLLAGMGAGPEVLGAGRDARGLLRVVQTRGSGYAISTEEELRTVQVGSQGGASCVPCIRDCNRNDNSVRYPLRWSVGRGWHTVNDVGCSLPAGGVVLHGHPAGPRVQRQGGVRHAAGDAGGPGGVARPYGAVRAHGGPAGAWGPGGKEFAILCTASDGMAWKLLSAPAGLAVSTGNDVR